MITAFILKNGRLVQSKISSSDDFQKEMIWIDLVDPTEEERALVEAHYNFELPEKAEIKDIEASARFYEDEDGIHVHSFFLNDFGDRVTNVTVAFSIYNGRLFTLHDEDLSSFRLYRLRARHPQINDMESVIDVMDILIGLHETAVEHVADVLELIYTKLESTSPYVLINGNKTEEKEPRKSRRRRQKELEQEEDDEQKKVDMDTILSEISIQEDINGKARLSLMDTRRSLSFLLRGRLLTNDQNEDVREILRDLESLTSHTSFLFDKVNFLLDAAMGKISLEQSRIIKIFSIASVVFLPPTLIASIYGMNFTFMPELNFRYSYPLSIGLMFLSGIAPYLLFKRKGWL